LIKKKICPVDGIPNWLYNLNGFFLFSLLLTSYLGPPIDNKCGGFETEGGEGGFDTTNEF
jgi:hypothetical protein